MTRAVPHFASRCVSSVSLRVGLMVLFLASVSLLQPTLANAQARQSADSAAKHVKGPAPGSVAQRPGAQRPGAQRANPPPAQKASAAPAPSRQRAASTAVRTAGSQHTQSAQRAAPPGARAARVSPQMAEARRGTDMRNNRPARALPAVAATTAAAAVAVPTIGRAIGLHQVADPLSLRSSVALVMDQQTGQVVYQKN
ncbi:MAG: hypothetical protein ACK49H_02595, partial [Burkholderiales bacterium]